MRPLRLAPAAEHVVDRDQVHLRELLLVPGGDGGVDRSIVVARGDLLGLRREPETEVLLGDLARALPVGVPVDQRDRRLGEDRERGRHDLQLAGPQFPDRQVGLVLPRDEHVSDAALDEGVVEPRAPESSTATFR